MYHYETKLGLTEYYWNEPDDCGRQEKFDKQKEKLGFDDREIWNLDCTFVAWVYPRLKRYIKVTKGSHPGCFTSYKPWKKILKQIVKGFEIFLKSDGNTTSVKDNEAIDKSFELFSQYIRTLWC